MSEIINAGSNIFFENVVKLIENVRSFVGRTADLTMSITYFEIGRMIVEEEQGGAARAEYGRGLLEKLAAYLTERCGRGFSESTLKNARKFYQIYGSSIRQTMFAKSEKMDLLGIGQTLFAESNPFRLGWSHYLILMRIKSKDERRFYEIEAANQKWTYRELQRHYGSSLYEGWLSLVTRMRLCGLLLKGKR